MMEKICNELQLRVLLSFLKKEKKACTVTGIARTLGEAKYTVSRIAQALEEKGLLDRSDIYHPALTEEGAKCARYYQSRVALSESHLLYEGVDLESARRDAYIWAIYNSDSTMEVLKEAEAINRVKYELRDKTSFSGTELCSHFKDGYYKLQFFIYREVAQMGRNLSMGNAGFEHPATLYIKNGRGNVLLKSRQIEMPGEDRVLRKGSVKSLKYFDNGDFTLAEGNGRIISFPASAIDFDYMGEGMNGVIHGNLTLKIKASVGESVMPESTAIFTVLI